MEGPESTLFEAHVTGVFTDHAGAATAAESDGEIESESDTDIGTDESAVETRVALETAESAFLINPPQDALETMVQAIEPDAPGSIRLFAPRDPLADLFEEFTVASTTADLVRSDVLSIRLLESVPRHSLLVTDRQVVSLVKHGDRIRGLATDADSFVTDTYERYQSRWHDADEYSLRVPPFSRVESTLEAELGDRVASDFRQALGRVDGIGQGSVDEVAAALLAAAKHDKLLYDISRWGEEIGLASKATFSRTKNTLEETDVLDTEKVPIEVGRPRLRLTVGPDRLADAPIEQVVETTVDQLS